MLPAQCRIPSAVRRASEKFMYRQPGAVSKSSKQVPKQAQVSGTIRQPGPALLRRGSGNRDPPRETPSKGRELPARPGLQAAARTRNQSPEKKGGGEGEPRSEATVDQAPPKSFELQSPRPSIRGAAAASTPPAHTTEAGARGEQPAPGLLTLLRSPGPDSSQTRLK
ncbi:hypothetical protein NDU88_006407 [Pleurodeles waltl]|uniref:Uncharacterized protein n=1 Tax=Pleurodeles waltl TaxID=8319 RepID=A0AAV7SPE3_PLEWA|nr:hypothetical protein NDU88_006407 [Pleurodeles waltl]